MNSLLLVLSLVVGQSESLARLDFHHEADARAAWIAGEGTPPVSADDGVGGRALRVDAPLASNSGLRRVVVDHDVDLNLAAPTSFTLDVNPSHPELLDHATLYFHSVDGWFSAGARLANKGWQTLSFQKSAFGTEGTPKGWYTIDRIRIAVWKSTSNAVQPRDATVLLRGLRAGWNHTAIMLPDSKQQEWRASHDAADTLEAMLGELGVSTDRLTESSLLNGALGKRRLVLLPYNRPTDEVCEVLKKFVQEGGKTFLCYAVPDQLQETIGFRRGIYYRPEGDAPELATIRFDTGVLAGLPAETQQGSWNIATAQPAGHGARVIGWWYDNRGGATGKAAMLLSDRAAYLSHIVLPDDWDAKKEMLAAVLGGLDQNVWHEIVAAGVERAQRVGHCRSSDQLADFLAPLVDASGREKLLAADRTNQQARRLLRSGNGHEASQAIHRCRQLRVEAYLNAQPSRSCEARAFWEHSGLGAYPGDWDRTCKELAQAGFNMVIPNMLWAGVAHYPSDVLPRSRAFQEHGDQLAQCLAAAKKYGLEVHVWKVNHNPGHLSPRDFIDRMRREGRTQVDYKGEVTDWLNPAHPENFQLEVDSMLEVVRNYDVDGIHFDYIRYPNGNLDYSEFSRNRFQADTGLTVTNWPQDCHSGPLRAAYRDWRAEQITRLVESVSREARKIRPGVKISAAVFGDYPSCRDSVGQEWPLWAQRGYVDFLCPMNYTDNDDQFLRWTGSQKKLVGRIPLYPGIGATASRSTLTADRVVGQIHLARSLDADGFTIFNLTEKTAREILPGIHAGATRSAARTPHRQTRHPGIE